MDPDDENPGYRSPAGVVQDENASVQDEHDFSTLLAVQRELSKGVAEIDSIHVFDLTEGALTVKQQIVAYRKARFILEPILRRVDSAIESVKLMQENK